MTLADYHTLSDNIPTEPGVYRFLDKENTILYVGKAKNLKNRLSSYFGDKKHLAFKTVALVRHAHHIEYTVVPTEHDALLLENNLIKAHQPRYNVMLKDGKSYTYICIKNERFPRVFFTRKLIKDGSTYFGPYTSKYRARILLDIIKKLFPLRTCTLNLSAQNIERKKFKVCLEYHIHNCQGPCEGLESETDYTLKILQIKNILKGQLKEVKKYMTEQMHQHADALEFEKAQQLKEKMATFDDYQSTSTVVSTTIHDVDVFSIQKYKEMAFINYLKVIDGVLVNTDIIELKMNLDDDERDILNYAIPQIRERHNSLAPEVVVPMDCELEDIALIKTIPQRGDKRKLLELADNNLDYFILQKRKEALNSTKKISSAERILTTLKEDLNMEVMPMHIECFDNSNIQGTHPVSSCVVFKNAKPSNKDYRHYNIKTVIGPNDFASMTEVVYRRYKRLLDENHPLPQLIIIDGGKGQLGAAMESLHVLGITHMVKVIGIAKKLEEIFVPGDSVPIYLNKKSESLKLIQHARNEAHRFAISFHRNQRSKNFLKNRLENITGIGPKTAQKLLKEYGSVERIKIVNLEELTAFIGQKLAETVLKELNQ